MTTAGNAASASHACLTRCSLICALVGSGSTHTLISRFGPPILTLSMILSRSHTRSFSLSHTHTITHSHNHTHSLSLVLVAVMKPKELKTKSYHTHSLILSLTISTSGSILMLILCFTCTQNHSTALGSRLYMPCASLAHRSTCVDPLAALWPDQTLE